jgi:hypothetical protein
MATNKKSFLVYTNWAQTFENLTDDEAGKLIKHVFRYVNDENPTAPDRITELIFEPLKAVLKSDLIKYENVKEEKSISGRMGNLKRWNNDLFLLVESNKMNLQDAENIAKNRKTSVSDKNIANAIKTSQKIAVNVNDNDIYKKLLSKIKISDVPSDLQLYFKIAKDFQNLFIKNLTKRNAPIKNQENATFKNYVDPIRLAIVSNECTINDLRDVWKYLDSPQGDFWQTNILSTATLRKHIQKLVMSARENKKQPKKIDKL